MNELLTASASESVAVALTTFGLIGLAEIGVTGDGTDIALVSFGNGVFLSHQAQARLAANQTARFLGRSLQHRRGATGMDVNLANLVYQRGGGLIT